MLPPLPLSRANPTQSLHQLHKDLLDSWAIEADRQPTLSWKNAVTLLQCIDPVWMVDDALRVHALES